MLSNDMRSIARARSTRYDLRELFERLSRAYGYQGWWPLCSRAGLRGYDADGYLIEPRRRGAPSAPERMEIIAGALLTQNTSWNNARRAVEALVQRGLMDPHRLVELAPRTLADAIRSSGSYNQKARKILEAARFLAVGRYVETGEAPERSSLLSVWGIGEESADSILLYAFGRPRFVIDAYARRLFARLGLEQGHSPYGELHDRCLAALPSDAELLGEYHALIVRHGKERCRAKPDCEACPLRERCDFGRSYSPES